MGGMIILAIVAAFYLFIVSASASNELGKCRDVLDDWENDLKNRKND